MNYAVSVMALAVVVSPAASQPVSRWTVDEKPTLVLGGAEDANALLPVIVGATRLPNGSVLVGDRGDVSFRIFDAAGKNTRSFARRGSGPGEVSFLGRMLRCGDSLYAYDIEGQRYSVYSLTGTYTRSYRLTPPAGETTPYRSACNRAGEFIHLGWEKRADMKGGAFRSTVKVWTSRADTVQGRVVDSVAGSERWGLVVDNRIRGTSPLPLGKQPVLGLGSQRAYVGDSERFEVRAISLTGDQLGLLRRQEVPQSVTSADVDRARSIEVANAPAARKQGIESRFNEMVMPKTLPAYSELVVDAGDNVWVQHYPRAHSASVTWSVFNARGLLVAEVALPEALQVLEVGDEYVLGRYLDIAEQIPSVRLYRLRRGSR